MMINVTRSSMPDFEEYCEEIKELWDSHWLTNMGTKHKQLQASLESFLDCPHVILYGEETLQAIVQNCDELIVMDYYCNTAVENVQTEVELCRKFNKVCQIALEISDPAREEGIEETSTYWNLGVAALEEDIEALKAAYPDIGITIHQAKYLDEFYSK